MNNKNENGNGNQVAGTKLMTKVEMKIALDRMVMAKDEAVKAYKKMLAEGKLNGECAISATSKLVYHLINDPVSTKVNIEFMFGDETIADAYGPIMEFDKVYCELIGRAYIKIVEF